LKLIAQLALKRCPHCGVDSPTMEILGHYDTVDIQGTNRRCWASYFCRRCGGVVIASALAINGYVQEIFPRSPRVDESVPQKAREFLTQAIDSKAAPAGAVMLTASAVDAMLKAKQYIEGSLYTRIDKAADDHLITSDMAQWAHQIRLEANDQRHADQKSELPTEQDADRVIKFALALAEFLFVLPAKIQKGIAG